MRQRDHVHDGVVAGDAVAVTSTADLVVPEDVNSSSAFRTGVVVIVEGGGGGGPSQYLNEH